VGSGNGVLLGWAVATGVLVAAGVLVALGAVLGRRPATSPGGTIIQLLRLRAVNSEKGSTDMRFINKFSSLEAVYLCLFSLNNSGFSLSCF